MTQIACTLDNDGLADRRSRWIALGERSLVEIVPTGRGQQLVFRADAGPELRELAELERDCCAFADWDVRAEDGHAVLDVAGRDAESIAAVQGMFGPLRALL